MSRLPAVRRPTALGLAAAALLAAAAPPARAQAPITFDALTDVDGSGVRYVANCYVEGGFRFTLVGLGCGDPGADAAFATWTADNPLYATGTPALYNNLGASVDFARAGGGVFALRSLGLAPLLGAFGEAASVTFVGTLAGGGTVTRTVDVPGATNALTDVTFAGFVNLRSVRMTVDAPGAAPYVQFDNVAVGVVPEPATVALVGAGALALGALARRRRA